MRAMQAKRWRMYMARRRGYLLKPDTQARGMGHGWKITRHGRAGIAATKLHQSPIARQHYADPKQRVYKASVTLEPP